MTIQELYDWAKEKGVLNYELRVQYRDEGGDYYGEDDELRLCDYPDNKTVIL